MHPLGVLHQREVQQAEHGIEGVLKHLAVLAGGEDLVRVWVRLRVRVRG